MSKKEQNDISSLREVGRDLGGRWEKILNTVTSTSDFTTTGEKVREIQWWKTGKVGSVTVYGQYEGVPAVLKIQGTRPRTSQAEMIANFASQNKSKTVRPPQIFESIKWDDALEYEALILEEVKGSFPLTQRPSNSIELDKYFEIYEEYKVNCIQDPWLKRPGEYDYSKTLSSWMDAVIEQSSSDPFKDENDIKLVDKAVSILTANLNIDDLEFMHGHFQTGDLHKVGNEVILTSNLFWSYRVPFYDAVFGYHWWMLGMEHKPDLTSNDLESERDQWLNKMYNLDSVNKRKDGEKMVTFALLERAIPALMVDRYMTDQSKHSAKVIAEHTRKELNRLVNELS